MDQSLPAYAYVPGGPWPHPAREAERLGIPRPIAPPIEEDDWSDSPLYLHGIALFNGGYYWESHEAWEYLWHAHHRQGPTADVLKALIKLGAAGVKVRDRQPHGVRIHARRASDLFQAVAREHGPNRLGLDLFELARHAARIAANPPEDPRPIEAAVSVVFDFRLEPA